MIYNEVVQSQMRLLNRPNIPCASSSSSLSSPKRLFLGCGCKLNREYLGTSSSGPNDTSSETKQPLWMVVFSIRVTLLARIERVTMLFEKIVTLSQIYAPFSTTLSPMLQFLPIPEFATREFSPMTVPDPI